jgi:Flp pilus assembly pilin Flp
MTDFVNRLQLLARDRNRDRGASAVEYALIVILITAVLAVGFGIIGQRVKANLKISCDRMATAQSNANNNNTTCP